MRDLLSDSERWRKRAEELRAVSEDMTDPNARRTVLRLANGYDLLAERCERRGSAAAAERV